MTDMIERVARAIASAEGAPIDASVEDATPMAIAAIHAMMEPTMAMRDAAFEAWLNHEMDGVILPIWQAMIDAALTRPAAPASWQQP